MNLSERSYAYQREQANIIEFGRFNAVFKGIIYGVIGAFNLPVALGIISADITHNWITIRDKNLKLDKRIANQK